MGKPGLLQFMGSQKSRWDLAAEQHSTSTFFHINYRITVKFHEKTTLKTWMNFERIWKWKCNCSVMSDYLRPHGLQSTRLLCQWNSPGKNTGLGSHYLLQGIFPTQVSKTQVFCIVGRFFTLWTTRKEFLSLLNRGFLCWIWCVSMN